MIQDTVMTISLMSILFSILFSMSAVQVTEAGLSSPPFIEEFIVRNGAKMGSSRQLVFATGRDAASFVVTVHVLEKKGRSWMLVSPPFSATIGEKGFASPGQKKEGDGKSPPGIFTLGMAFGYDATLATRMTYRQITDDDFWVDDVDSEDYNRWVRGRPNAVSMEKMKREDDIYKYGIVIEYNANPIVKGKGSAIFIHRWAGAGKPTLGCVAMPEDKVLRLLQWLDPASRPLIIMGTETELGRLRFQ
jgi:L,D-peptidoglycan transpeptidase YkuD (ErfK/YbiS/YcfS/YnhG family)